MGRKIWLSAVLVTILTIAFLLNQWVEGLSHVLEGYKPHHSSNHTKASPQDEKATFLLGVGKADITGYVAISPLYVHVVCLLS